MLLLWFSSRRDGNWTFLSRDSRFASVVGSFRDPAQMSVFMMIWLTPLIQKKVDNEAGLLRIWDYFVCSGELQAPAFATAVIVREVIDRAVAEKVKGLEAADYLQEHLAKISENLVLTPEKADWVVHQAVLLHEQVASNPVSRLQFNNMIAHVNKGYGNHPTCPFELSKRESAYCSQVSLSQTVSLLYRRYMRPLIQNTAVRYPEALVTTYCLLLFSFIVWFWSVFGISRLLVRVDPVEIVG